MSLIRLLNSKINNRVHCEFRLEWNPDPMESDDLHSFCMALNDKFNAEKFEPFTIELDGKKFEVNKNTSTYRHFERKLTQNLFKKDSIDTTAPCESSDCSSN
jgi:hypothetical protein